MSKFVFATIFAAAAIAAPAFAQDNAAPTTFSGPHVEALGGWDRVQAGGGHDDGALYGVGAGYDVRRGNLVFGVEAEANDSSEKEKFGNLTLKASRDLYAGARIGTVVGGNNLLYAKAGYTNGRYKVEATGTGAGPSFSSGNLDGVRVGAGVEHALGDKAFVKAEYRYSNYEQGVSRNQVLAGVGLRF